MENYFKKAKVLVNRILKNLGDSTLEWTLQVSENTANPGKITYACMIHVSDRLEPLVWTCDSWEELLEKLEKASKELNKDMVQVAYFEGEIKRCERLKKYYEEKIAEIASGSDKAES